MSTLQYDRGHFNPYAPRTIFLKPQFYGTKKCPDSILIALFTNVFLHKKLQFFMFKTILIIRQAYLMFILTFGINKLRQMALLGGFKTFSKLMHFSRTNSKVGTLSSIYFLLICDVFKINVALVKVFFFNFHFLGSNNLSFL